MADRFWKSMPAALKIPTLDELYKRLRDLDYTQVDERLAVMLNAILQLEAQGECRESATEAVLMFGDTTEGISNQEQTRWLSWNADGGVRGFDLARNSGLSNNTEYGAGEFPLPTRPPARSEGRVPTGAEGTREANCEQLKSELEKIQRRQREFARQKEKGFRTTERAATWSRPESLMEVDEVSRSSGRFNLDRATQEHINKGLEVWIPPEPVSSVRGLEVSPMRPLMDVALPGYFPSSTPSSSQVSGSSSRLKELHDRLQLGTRDDSTRRDQPVRIVVIASYEKNTDGRYPRHNPMDWTTEQRARRDCFHDASWAEYYAQSRIPEGAVHLIIGDILIRVLTRIQSHWQTGVLSFSGAATPQMLASLEMLDMVKMYTVTLMMGTNDVSRGESSRGKY